MRENKIEWKHEHQMANLNIKQSIIAPKIRDKIILFSRSQGGRET